MTPPALSAADGSGHLDLPRWPRRAAFDFFRGYAKPWFSVCVMLDVAALKAAVAASGRGSFWLAYHFAAMRVANHGEPMRLRFTPEAAGVRRLARVHAGTTVLRTDGSFGMLTLEQTEGWRAFVDVNRPRVAAALDPAAPFLPEDSLPASEGLVHTTTLPWLHFTSFEHARERERDADVPKLAFGRAVRDGARLLMPLAIEVHHALVDGLHVGEYVQALQAACDGAAGWIDS
jgi:chloramphenicol O-acetyltransferase type A